MDVSALDYPAPPKCCRHLMSSIVPPYWKLKKGNFCLCRKFSEIDQCWMLPLKSVTQASVSCGTCSSAQDPGWVMTRPSCPVLLPPPMHSPDFTIRYTSHWKYVENVKRLARTENLVMRCECSMRYDKSNTSRQEPKFRG